VAAPVSQAEPYVYEPRRGHGLPQDPFNAIVAPRPIGWIGTVDVEGRLNLAPYSFFNAFNYDPPIVGFASTGWKDSVRNAEATGAFTWSLVTRAQAEAMNATSATVGPEVDEFALAGLEPEPSRFVEPPGVAGSPVVFECRRTQTVRLADAGGREVQTWLVLGEVVGVRIAPGVLKDGVFDTAAVAPVLRGGGAADYFEIGPEARFRMRRPG
jgi:flavin reductase (DIM6/NTAB) family NADH-FMN oxidoreductase RutF